LFGYAQYRLITFTIIQLQFKGITPMQGLIFSIIPTQGDALCYRITPFQGLSFFRVDTGPIFSIIPTQSDALCYRIMPFQGFFCIAVQVVFL